MQQAGADMRVLQDDDIPYPLWEELFSVNVHATPFQAPAFLPVS